MDAAVAAGDYVVLDLQPGRTDFLTQAQQYAELLDFFTGAGDYWIPAYAGMTVVFLSGARRAHTRIGISTYSAGLFSSLRISVGAPASAR